ncbi:MAG TPA: alpha/beta hydrolase [Burkholderiales bacterium]
MLPTLKTAGTIAYRESGMPGAPAVVLLHGIGSTAAGWRLQFAPLAQEARVIAWDAPGYGGSAPLATATPVAEDYARALAGLLDALGVKAAVIGSNSWGTPTAVAFAVLYPARVRALVLGGPANGMAGLPAAEREKLLEERIARVKSLGLPAMRVQDAPRLVAPGTRDEVMQWISGSEGIHEAGYLQALQMLARADCARTITGVACPVTVISGENDLVTPPETNAKRIAAAAPNATLTMVPDCGHLPHLEFPDLFNEALREALAI